MIGRMYYLVCNRCRSKQAVYYPSAADARAAARKAGWSRVPKRLGSSGEDICGRCVASVGGAA